MSGSNACGNPFCKNYPTFPTRTADGCADCGWPNFPTRTADGCADCGWPNFANGGNPYYRPSAKGAKPDTYNRNESGPYVSGKEVKEQP